MPDPEKPALAITERGGITENSHLVHAAVVDARGRLLCRLGDPHRLTLVRSAAKPAQAIAVLESGAFDRFGLDDGDLALMCASHSSEDRHVARASAMLAKAGALESDLRCGGHPAINESINRVWIKQDFTPTPVYSNCSGKHAGMLAAAAALDAGFAGYNTPDHPVQVLVRRTVARIAGLDEAGISWAIDGCNLPTPALPLERLALMYARLAAAADVQETAEAAAGAGGIGGELAGTGGAGGEHAGAASADTPHLARIYHAMSVHPELVGGEGRFCTILMQSFAGGLIGKVGADASYAIGIRAAGHPATGGADGAVGLAVKIEDGNTKVLYAVVSELLEQLGIGTAEQRRALAGFHRPAALNTAGVETGRISFSFSLAA